MKKILILLLPLSIVASDLQEIVSKVQSNEMINSLNYVVKAQENERDAIVANYLPKIKANFMYQYIPENNRGLFDPEHSTGLEASAVIFDGFKRSESIMAQNSRIDSTKEGLKHQIELYSLNAVNLYFNIKTLQANIDARKQKEKQLENDLARLERFYEIKSITEDKVELVRAALAITRYEIEFLKQNYQELELSLETLTGETIKVVGSATLIDKTVESSENSHELSSLEYEIKALRHDAKTKTAQYWPSVIVKDTFTSNQYYEADTSLPFDISLPSNTNKVQILASMTLFDFFAKSKERQIIQMQRQAKKSEYSFKKRDSDLKKRFAIVKLQTLKAKIAASELSLKASKKSFEFIDKKQKANLVDTSIYLDAASQFYNAKSILEASKYEYQMALANYYFYNNIPLMEMIK